MKSKVRTQGWRRVASGCRAPATCSESTGHTAPELSSSTHHRGGWGCPPCDCGQARCEKMKVGIGAKRWVTPPWWHCPALDTGQKGSVGASLDQGTRSCTHVDGVPGTLRCEAHWVCRLASGAVHSWVNHCQLRACFFHSLPHLSVDCGHMHSLIFTWFPLK